MSLKLKVHQITNAAQLGYPNWYSSVSYEKKVMDLDALAQHMADHNTPYSKGVIKGILTDMVTCIREQALLGRKIRIDGLALLKLGVDSYGAETYKEAKQRSMIKRVKLMIFPNGDFTSSELADASIEWIDDYNPLNVRNFKITAVANDATMGTVTGGGTFQENSEITLVAKAKTGFVFSKWQDDNTEATRVITVTEAKQYVATFVASGSSTPDSDDSDEDSDDTDTSDAGTSSSGSSTQSGGSSTQDSDSQSGTSANLKVVTITTDPEGVGNVTGAGSYAEGTEITISASPKDSSAYKFTGWNNGSTEATQTITVTKNLNFIANFEAVE